jgi:hypothetical protein
MLQTSLDFFLSTDVSTVVAKTQAKIKKMKTLILAILFFACVFATTVETSVDRKKSKDVCNMLLFRNFNRFTIKHNIRNLLIRRINYVESSVYIGLRNMRGCEGYVRTNLYCL